MFHLGRVDGDADDESRTAAGGRFKVKSAADRVDAFLHADQAESSAAAGLLRDGRVEANAIVLHFAAEKARLQRKLDGDGGSAGVFDDIVERFLQDTIEGDFDGGRDAAFEIRRNADGNSRASGDGSGEKMDGGNEAKVVKDGGTQLVRILAQLRFDLLEEHVHVFEIGFELWRGLPLETGESQMDRDEELAGFIVNAVGDALDLFFEEFVHAAQRRYGFLETAIGHFEGREDFSEELRGPRREAVETSSTVSFVECLDEGFLMDEDDFDEAGATRHGFAAEFVAAAERRFPTVEEVGAQSGCVVFRERRNAFAFGGGNRFH